MDPQKFLMRLMPVVAVTENYQALRRVAARGIGTRCDALRAIAWTRMQGPGRDKGNLARKPAAPFGETFQQP
jgi:hypothetical protein